MRPTPRTGATLLIALTTCLSAPVHAEPETPTGPPTKVTSSAPNEPAPRAAVSTAFSYQGELTESGTVFDGTAEMRFRLFDAVTSGAMVGIELLIPDVEVIGGRFAVELDFGGEIFDGAGRWLEIEVDGVVLSPRQPLLPAPYALHALNAPGGSGGEGLWVYGTAVIHTTADVGIGTTSPDAPLEIVSDRSSSSDNTARFSAPNIGHRISHVHWGTKGDWYIRSADPTGKVLLQDNGGNVGIGTGSPQALLHVDGDGPHFRASDVVGGALPGPVSVEIDGQAIEQTGTNFFNKVLWVNKDSDSNIILARGGGNVGIGPTGPVARLQVSGGTDSDPSGGGYIVSGDVLASNISIDNNEIMARNDGQTSTLYLNHSGGEVQIAATDPTPKVGIGTNPSAALHVDVDNADGLATFYQHGTGAGMFVVRDQGAFPALHVVSVGTGPAMRVQGTAAVDVLEIEGADLAERFPVSDQPEPGMVMEIDPDNPGALRVARGAYNRRVAGVVSGANDLPAGAILGNRPESADAPPVAMAGRVWVRCVGDVSPGDLLTTSDTAGHAMAVRDHARAQGAIIGKAMTEREPESGMALVLVSLQ